MWGLWSCLSFKHRVRQSPCKGNVCNLRAELWNIYIIIKSMRALWLVNQLWLIVPVNPWKNHPSSELLYKSKRPQASTVYIPKAKTGIKANLFHFMIYLFHGILVSWDVRLQAQFTIYYFEIVHRLGKCNKLYSNSAAPILSILDCMEIHSRTRRG